MVSAYAAFANGGIGVQPHVIMTRAHRQRQGCSTAAHPYNYGRVIEPRYVAMMNSMMQETLLIGTAHKADLPGWQAAGKTGTSQDLRDAWFVGYTSHLVAGVWLGNDDGAPTKKVSGGNLPVEIWSRFMRDAHAGRAGRRACRSATGAATTQPAPAPPVARRRADGDQQVRRRRAARPARPRRRLRCRRPRSRTSPAAAGAARQEHSGEAARAALSVPAKPHRRPRLPLP